MAEDKAYLDCFLVLDGSCSFVTAAYSVASGLLHIGVGEELAVERDNGHIEEHFFGCHTDFAVVVVLVVLAGTLGDWLLRRVVHSEWGREHTARHKSEVLVRIPDRI